ncbi:ATP-dependent helicase [Siminovitchia fortis]|uniref:ATP-dependent helicase n=1 Tax=Siminovitchia fortis TaxID=254758 RepID=UPI0011A76A0D|nr:ATP-dependent helicase [Siminovitchia fortis]
MSHEFFCRMQAETGVILNEVQKKAVLQTEGPLLLLASPGSGKTTTIIMRIGYLIQEKNVSPARIKAVTFSRASASDMKERFKQFFPGLPSVDFSTIHSLAYETVREQLYKERVDYQIIEGNTENGLHKKLILRKLFESVAGETMTDDQLEELMTYISFIKNKMIAREDWPSVKCTVPKAVKILQRYEKFKQTGHQKLLLDFDDMLTMANDIFENEKELLKKYQSRYDYILTDESQDTSLVQHKIIEKLAREHRNLCVVADDDQSIYSWRGAEPSYLLNFKKTYPNADVLFMEQNYRSSKEIVETANIFIKQNKNRYAKNMFTKNSSSKPIIFKKFSDYKRQAKYLVKEIREEGNLSDIAVLYRNNSSSISLINEFDRAGIPFFMIDADNRFFSHWVVSDILNFMRMTFSDKRPDILEKIHTKLNGYITKKQMMALKRIRNNESVFDNLINFVQLKDYQVGKLIENKETFQQMKGMPPLHAIHVIRGRLGYEKALEKMCERLGFRKEYLLGILNTLEEIAQDLKTMEEFAARLKHLEAKLKTSQFKKDENAVTFSTFHSAKGLEFEKVYMIDLVDGVIPSADDKKGDMEEAVRLFYVGMTRAKKHLELISYQKKEGSKEVESQFVSDVWNIVHPSKKIESKGTERHGAGKRENTKDSAVISPNAIRDRSALRSGMTVKHRVFGTGTITSVDQETINIQFTKQVKALSVEMCLERGLLELV